MTTLQLGSIDLGGGLKALQAWAVGGPIVLVSTVGSSGEKKNSRLDIDKAMFIDPLPGKPTPAGVVRVVERLRGITA